MFKKKDKNQQVEAVNTGKKKKKFKKRYVVLAVLVIAIIAAAANNRMAADRPVSVMVKTVGTGDLTQTLDVSGTVESEETKIYFANTSAQIQSLNAELGGTVKKGDSLLTYNVDKLERTAKQAELEAKASDYGIDAAVTTLNYSQQKAAQAAKDYEDAVKYVNHYSAMVTSIKEDLLKASQAAEKVKSLTSELSDAQKKLQQKPNSEKLQNKVKELTSDLKEANKEVAKYDVTALNASLETCSADLAAYESLKAQYEAQKEADPSISSQRSQQSTLREVNELAKQQTEESIETAREGVVADFDGIVTSVGAVEGMTVMEGTELFTVASDKQVKVSIEVSKYDLQKLAVGQRAEITINNQEYEGYVAKIARFAHVTQSGSSVLSADIHIDNPDDNIYLGIEGKVHIQTASAENTLLLPMECINADAKGDFCYVVENGVLVRKDVEIGISSDEYSQILSGLDEGAQVVSVVTADLTEGMNVVAVEEETPDDAQADEADK
ncbi:MAG: efflux RND transporter periplasmic adaptor subunit [Lachnospiraceae bacterium]|nr:efflux RND transporter periplasmic adaptor subunit [Lachnospiraceae bacterium]